jgi:hypothetical protein
VLDTYIHQVLNYHLYRQAGSIKLLLLLGWTLFIFLFLWKSKEKSLIFVISFSTFLGASNHQLTLFWLLLLITLIFDNLTLFLLVLRSCKDTRLECLFTPLLLLLLCKPLGFLFSSHAFLLLKLFLVFLYELVTEAELTRLHFILSLNHYFNIEVFLPNHSILDCLMTWLLDNRAFRFLLRQSLFGLFC